MIFQRKILEMKVEYRFLKMHVMFSIGQNQNVMFLSPSPILKESLWGLLFLLELTQPNAIY